MPDIALVRARALTLASCWATIAAAVAPAQTVYVGLEGGGNVATFAGRDVGYASSKTGFAFGASARIPVNPAFAFRPAILYSQQGADQVASGVLLGIRLSYLEVPLLVDLAVPGPSSGILPHLYAGPVVDLQLGCSVSAASGSVSL